MQTPCQVSYPQLIDSLLTGPGRPLESRRTRARPGPLPWYSQPEKSLMRVILIWNLACFMHACVYYTCVQCPQQVPGRAEDGAIPVRLQTRAPPDPDIPLCHAPYAGMLDPRMSPRTRLESARRGAGHLGPTLLPTVPTGMLYEPHKCLQ